MATVTVTLIDGTPKVVKADDFRIENNTVLVFDGQKRAGAFAAGTWKDVTLNTEDE